MKQPRRVTVWYGDAHRSQDHFDLKDAEPRHKPVLKGATGWLVLSNRTGVTIATEWNLAPENSHITNLWEYVDPQFIPCPMIQRIEWLEGKTP
jgi:hypothetical protein